MCSLRSGFGYFFAEKLRSILEGLIKTIKKTEKLRSTLEDLIKTIKKTEKK